MTEAQRNEVSEETTTPQNGKGEARYCAICGTDATSHGPSIGRFGEAFCSEGHAEQFAKEVRAARIQAAALAGQEVRQPETPEACAPDQRGWKRYLKLGACCGAPLLALVILAGGGGALLGAAGALLPLLAMLACPIGMYFMMRGMSKMGHQENSKDKDEGK